MKKFVTKGANIDKLANKLANNKKKRDYKTGHPDEKVWINFQATKAQKREFNETCKKNNINASAFLRTCIHLLVKNEGDIGKTLNKVKSKEESA